MPYLTVRRPRGQRGPSHSEENAATTAFRWRHATFIQKIEEATFTARLVVAPRIYVPASTIFADYLLATIAQNTLIHHFYELFYFPALAMSINMRRFVISDIEIAPSGLHTYYE